MLASRDGWRIRIPTVAQCCQWNSAQKTAFLCATVKIRSQSDNHSVSNVYPQSGIRHRIWPEWPW